MKPRIIVILGSTREGRRSEMVGRWFMELAGERDDVECELVDLRDWDLPMLPFPASPGMGDYQDPLQIRWAERIAAADGFVLITPEYNHGYPAVLKNALDFVYAEWNRKPVAFVAYGSAGGGVRSVEQLRQVIVELQMVSVRSIVSVPRVWAAFEDGAPREAHHAKAARSLLDELAWWANALRAARDA